MELLTENANLQKKIALLESNSPAAAGSSGSASEINHDHHPWKHELDNAQAMIQELSKTLEDRGDVSDVELIKENANLRQLNETLAKKMQTQQEELCKSQTQLQVCMVRLCFDDAASAGAFVVSAAKRQVGIDYKF